MGMVRVLPVRRKGMWGGLLKDFESGVLGVRRTAPTRCWKSIMRDEGDIESCRLNVRYQIPPLDLGCASHQIRPTHRDPFSVTESLCSGSDIVDDCLLGFGCLCIN